MSSGMAVSSRWAGETGARASTVVMAMRAPMKPMVATMTSWMTMATISAPSQDARVSGRESMSSATPVSTSRAGAAPAAMAVAAMMESVMGWMKVDPK
ncbi:MAG: hypothetical protein ISP32_00785 [Thermoleophilia bacterium]|nr:hypothetical protein [Thermoleophilia bacterium]